MKDIRGTHAAAIKNAIFKEFGLQLISNNRRKNAKNVLDWKTSKEVKTCYNKLYDDSVNAVENITKHAFPTIHENDKKFYDLYIYAASVCDIVLNLRYPDTEISKKALE